MSEPVRIAVRLLGLLLLVAGIAGIVLLFKPGPSEVADWMGDNCAHSKTGPSEQCSVTDVIEILLISPLLLLIGFVLVLALRPAHKGPFTLDLSRRRG